MQGDYDYAGLQLEQAACPACQQSRFIQLMKGDRYGFGVVTAGCSTCGLVQTNPRPTEKELAIFYRDHYRRYYQGVYGADTSYVDKFGKTERQEYTAGLLSQALEGREVHTLLDCGCGEGSLFEALRRLNSTFRLYGVEPNPNFAAYARGHGAAAVFASIAEAGQSGVKFDCLVLIHVLEHFSDPVVALTELGRMASPSAILYVDVPDVTSYRSINDLHLAHLFHFSERTLALTLERGGWLVEQMKQHAPPHHPFSIRAVARRAAGSMAEQPVLPDTSGWDAVRRLKTQWRTHSLKMIAARVPGARMAWRAIRRLRG